MFCVSLCVSQKTHTEVFSASAFSLNSSKITKTQSLNIPQSCCSDGNVSVSMSLSLVSCCVCQCSSCWSCRWSDRTVFKTRRLWAKPQTCQSHHRGGASGRCRPTQHDITWTCYLSTEQDLQYSWSDNGHFSDAAVRMTGRGIHWIAF